MGIWLDLDSILFFFYFFVIVEQSLFVVGLKGAYTYEMHISTERHSYTLIFLLFGREE